MLLAESHANAVGVLNEVKRPFPSIEPELPEPANMLSPFEFF
jgi:hypothetical protein